MKIRLAKGGINALGKVAQGTGGEGFQGCPQLGNGQGENGVSPADVEKKGAVGQIVLRQQIGAAALPARMGGKGLDEGNGLL